MSTVSTQSVNDQVIDLLEPLAERHGLEVVATDVCGPKGHPIVRIYLDRKDGIDLDAITSANEWISEAMEEHTPVDGPYVLEVSSPGIDRPLRRLGDFERFIGSRAVVKTVRPVDGRRRFSGVIESVEGEMVVMDCDDAEWRVPHEDIAKANLKVDVDFGDE